MFVYWCWILNCLSLSSTLTRGNSISAPKLVVGNANITETELQLHECTAAGVQSAGPVLAILGGGAWTKYWISQATHLFMLTVTQSTGCAGHRRPYSSPLCKISQYFLKKFLFIYLVNIFGLLYVVLCFNSDCRLELSFLVS